MQDANTESAGTTVPRLSEAAAGVVGGVVAGAAYLVAQVSFTAAVRPEGAAEPLQRIAAILMGPGSAPPPAAFSFTVFGMALIIHFGLSMAFGRIVAAAVWRRRAATAILAGALAGLALYAVNFGWIAPLAFPWFEDSIGWVTIVDHALFGAVAAAVCVALRKTRP
ncbi:MAG TPA: hypothetical protein VGD76_06875 [Ramlibacter sp.]